MIEVEIYIYKVAKLVGVSPYHSTLVAEDEGL